LLSPAYPEKPGQGKSENSSPEEKTPSERISKEEPAIREAIIKLSDMP